uniref:Uncharacterized protein n=1 Tax=Nothobranchius kadleci TaxID=1051664 RepID=A0A1A8BJA7_NOTKA
MSHTPEYCDLLPDWFDLSGLSDLDDDEFAANDEILDRILACQTPPPPSSHEAEEILLNSDPPSPQTLDEIRRQIEQSHYQQGGGSVNHTSSSNDTFNQHEISESVSFSINHRITDPAEFYLNFIDILNRFAERGCQIARANDRIQFEINTQHSTHHVNFNYDGTNMMQNFQQLFDKLVQSNEALVADNDFNFRLLVVNNPSGAGK